MQAIEVSAWRENPRVVDVTKPRRETGQVVVKVSHYLIGASDLSFTRGDHYQGTDPTFQFPHVPGFRAAGTVAEVGGASALSFGTRVLINGFMACGRCKWCALGLDNHCLSRSLMGVTSGHSGAAAEFVAVPERQCHTIPDAVNSVASLLCSDASLLLHAYRRARLRIGESVVVVGAGRVGALAIAVAKAAGASPICVVEPSEQARQRAVELGAAFTCTSIDSLSERLKCLDGGPGADLVVEAVGTDNSISTALAAGRVGGRTILLGVLGPTHFAPNYYRDVINKENELISTFGKTNREFGSSLRMMGDGLIPLRPLTPDIVPIQEFESGWQAALQRTSGRIAIAFSGDAT